MSLFVHGSRRGFGTTTTFVLVIIGIALMILLGGDLLSRGSRISIERAYATGQLIRIANMALEEATRSEGGKDKIEDYMLAGIAQGGTPPPRDQPQARDDLVNQFLEAITPYDPNTDEIENVFPDVPDDQAANAMKPVKYPWRDPNGDLDKGQNTGMQFWGHNGRVIFGVDAAKTVKFKPETLRAAYKHELDSKILDIKDVEMRVVAFKAGLYRESVSNRLLRRPFVQEKEMGYGVVRARVTASWAMSKGPPIVRTLMCDRFFKLIAPEKPVAQGGNGEETQWKLFVYPGEWQREASGE